MDGRSIMQRPSFVFGNVTRAVVQRIGDSLIGGRPCAVVVLFLARRYGVGLDDWVGYIENQSFPSKLQINKGAGSR
jgi:hypothetical protein